MKNIAIFASGNGSNFEAIIEAKLECNIKLLVCDNSKAYALTRAKNHNIDTFVFDPKKFNSKQEYEQKIIEKMNEYKIDIIVLAGYMRIFSKSFVEKYENRIINIHPSKLPKYPGLNAIGQAVEAGEVEIGVSVHYVDGGVDTGEIIASEVISIKDCSCIEEIESLVHSVEHKLYPRVLKEKIL